MSVIADLESERKVRVSTQTLLIACLPAVAVGLLIRAWLMHTPLAEFNADEGVTGLQAYGVLQGDFRLMVAGNDYGSSTETYLFAPFLTFWSGVWPLRILPIVLSAVAGFALYWLARPILGQVPAIVMALIGWTTSGAVALLFLRAYMGYTTGFIALVVALGLACRAVQTERVARTAAVAGFATGFATWSHPIYGAVALLALIVPTWLRRREVRRWWLPLAAGGVLGVSPWLLYIAQTGLPTSASPVVETTYLERVTGFVTGLLPRAFGLQTQNGDWVGPEPLAVVVASLLVAGALVGMVLLVVRQGRATLPILVAGVLAFPCLALFAPLGSINDARYVLPFLPMVLMGLGAWLLLVPERIRSSPWLLVTVPTLWAVLMSVPLLHQQVGWTWADPNVKAEQMVSELDARQVRYVAGDYWGAYLVDYLGAGRFQAAVHVPVRFERQQAAVEAADPREVAFVYQDGQTPFLRLPADRYEKVDVGRFDLYLPVGS